MDENPVQEAFDRYGRALTEIDLEALADAYAYPALAVTRMGRQAIEGPEATRAFFAANGQAYRDRGIVGVRIVRPIPAYADEDLWIGLAELENLDASGVVVGVEHNAYQLVREDGAWRIAVTTPLDAR